MLDEGSRKDFKKSVFLIFTFCLHAVDAAGGGAPRGRARGGLQGVLLLLLLLLLLLFIQLPFFIAIVSVVFLQDIGNIFD